MHLIGCEENLHVNISKSCGIYGHLFLIHDKYILSKFVTNFIHNNKNNFDYIAIVEYQSKILDSNALIEYQGEKIDLSQNSDNEVLGLLNAWDIIAYYSSLLGDDYYINNPIKILGHEKLVDMYINFKQDILLSGKIEFLPREFAWTSNLYNKIRTGDNEKISVMDYVNSKKDIQNRTDQLREKVAKLNFSPSRGAIRFFLYHFFGFQTFSEERQGTVKLGTIFDPEKYIDTVKYKDLGITLKEGGQYDIVASILKGYNTLGLLSTGSGKSITFLLSGMLKPGVTLIVAPLKSLIDDQYTNLENNFYLRGITGRLHSGMTKSQKENVEKDLLLGKYKFFYCAPERLQIRSFLIDICINHGLKKDKFLNQIVIDEAHCLSEWGHDFRFSYLNIKIFKTYLSGNEFSIPIIGLTATASQIVKDDIILYLDIKYIVEESSLNRSNLSLEIMDVDDPINKPKVIEKLLKEKINYILANVANQQKKHITLISEKKNGLYKNAGIIFAIYGAIGKKKSAHSISQSAEGILNILRKSHSDENYVQMYSSTNPNFVTKCCPLCYENSPIHIDVNRGGGYKIYYDNITEEYVKNQNLLTNKMMAQTITQPNEFWVCSNSVCGWKSFEYEDTGLQKPIQNTSSLNNDQQTGWNIEKTKIQDNFKNNKIGLLVATKGFGMGIDKSNIRYIIHATLSGSLESYYQEIGRAGRDKKHSHCILLFSGPSESCLRDSNNLKNGLPCMSDPSDFQFQNCPKGLTTMCDIARQHKMIVSPIVVGAKKYMCYLHKKLNTEEFLSDINNALLQIDETKHTKIKNLLMDNISTNFSHSLTEFFQLYFFYMDIIKPIANKKNDIIELVIDTTNKKGNDSSGYEKMIFRLMTMGIFSHYYKDYRGLSKIHFIINKEKNFSIETVSDYLNSKLKIPYRQQNKAFTSGNYSLFISRLEGQSELIKQLRKLIYFTYEKVEAQRKEMLMNLYQSIQKSKSKCFREEIIGRLSGLSKNNLSGCGFCSGCVPDTRKFQTTNGALDQDRNIREENSILKKQFAGEKLTNEEQRKITQYETTFVIEKRILSLYEGLEHAEPDLSLVTNLIEMINENNYSIKPLLQKTFEAGTYHYLYYLLDAYYNEDRREERLHKIFSLIGNNESLLYDFGRWCGSLDKVDHRVENILSVIKDLDYDIHYFQIGRLTTQGDLSVEQLKKILIVSKALQSFRPKNK